MISVVVPAHDEERVIGRCLEAITKGALPGEIDVVVAYNGCTDRTAEIAAGFGPSVQTVESPVSSKVDALNHAERFAKGFPRFYIDADVVVPLDSLRKVAEVLSRGDIHAAAPTMQLDLSGCEAVVRWYYEMWRQLPYAAKGPIGSGVYALSEEGRNRFDEFPDTFAEDTYVEELFEPHERASVAEAWFRVTPPQTLPELIRVLGRRRRGRVQLRTLHREKTKLNRIVSRNTFLRLALRPANLGIASVYAAVKVIALVQYYARIARGQKERWERDESSRLAGSATAGDTRPV